MHRQDKVKAIWQWVRQNSYAASVLAVLTVMILLASTDGFAGARRWHATREERAAARQLAQQAENNVWCITHITTEQEQRLILGHYPGQPLPEVLRWHGSAPWLATQSLETDCQRTWKQAVQATAALAEAQPETVAEAWQKPPRRASDNERRQAVLAAFLDQPRVTYPLRDEATSETAERWCMSRLRTNGHTLYHIPHPVGGRGAVEQVLTQLPDRTHLARYRIDATACFTSINDAEVWLWTHNVDPPGELSISAYVEAIDTWISTDG